jgi:parvulin-like peptidyl-prolyl isomerase
MKKIILELAIVAGLLVPQCVVAQLAPSHNATMPEVAPIPTAPAAPAKPAGTPIARINGIALTQGYLDEEMQRLFPYYAIHGGRVPPSAEADLQKQAMHDAVLHELVYQEALRRKTQVPPQEWQKRMRDIRQSFSTRKAFDAGVTKQYGSTQAFEKRLRRAMLVQTLWKQEVDQKSVVTTEMARKYYLAHKEQYARPESVWLQSITIKIPANATAEQKQAGKKVAEEILVKAKAAKTYEEFGVLAEQLSQDDWRVMMGDHRWVHRGTVTHDIEDTVFSLEEGKVSGVIETAAGYVILRSNGHQPKRQMTFTEMSRNVREKLRQEAREKRSKQFEEALRSKAKVEVL